MQKKAEVFSGLLDFWFKTEKIDPSKAQKLLIPNKGHVEKLRSEYIPQLIQIIGKEARYGIYQTLHDLLRFLSYYSQLTLIQKVEPLEDIRRSRTFKHQAQTDFNEFQTVQKSNKYNHIEIKLLPVFEKISIELLKNSEMYKEHAINPKNFLSCRNF